MSERDLVRDRFAHCIPQLLEARQVNALDIEKPDELGPYLRDKGLVAGAERLSSERLDGGVSNRTVLVRLEDRGEAWVLKQALPKLRVEADWYSDTARVHRESLGLRWLMRLLPEGSVPGFVFEDFDHHLLVMEAVREPHDNWKALLLEGEVRLEHVERFGLLLGTLHRSAVDRHPELREAFGDKSFFWELRLEPYYDYAAARVPEAGKFMSELITSAQERADTLVHGDYSPKNVLVRGDQLILLDHEVMHFGDPAFDLGFGLTHLLSKAHHLVAHRSAFGRAARTFWTSYCRSVGAPAADLEARAVRHTLGCMLARVAGRSPLEYLDARERVVQKRLMLELIDSPPATVAGLIAGFLGGVE